jgi:hypothetical protein
VANLDAENRRERPLRLWHIITMFSSSNADGNAASATQENETPGH